MWREWCPPRLSVRAETALRQCAMRRVVYLDVAGPPGVWYHRAISATTAWQPSDDPEYQRGEADGAAGRVSAPGDYPDPTPYRLGYRWGARSFEDACYNDPAPI